MTTHDATEDDDDQTDVIYNLLMTWLAAKSLWYWELRIHFYTSKKKNTLNIEILIVYNHLEYYSG